MLTRKKDQGSEALTNGYVRVLLVSNNANDTVLLRHLLAQIKGIQYVLIRSESLKHAIQLIESKACDVVLLNYFWDSFKIGGRFVKKAKSVNSKLPIIVFSAETEPQVERQIITLGASDYIALSEINARILDRTLRYALQRKSIEQRLEHLANYDYLTQLPNRMLYQERLRQFIRVAERQEHTFALMLLDLNDFKIVNDSHGHDVGDEMLKAFAQRLRKVVRRNDMVARVGGDEFTLLFYNVLHKELAEQLVYKLLKELEEPVDINGNSFQLRCSIGIAMYPSAGTDAETLQRNADMAMYHAKMQQGSDYCFYSSNLGTQIAVQQNPPEDVNANFIFALANNQIGLYFNPRFECATDRIVGIEVNPYWDHPEKGILEYDSFDRESLNAATSSRFIEWLLATSLEYFKQLSVSPGTKLILNIDFNDLLFPSFSQMVSSKLHRYCMSGYQIEFDLCNVHIDQHSQSMLQLCVADLQHLGVSFGLNAFGSDNLPLLKLDDIPFDVFKLDKRFVQGIHPNSTNHLANSFVQFAHGLGKKILVEGQHHQLPIGDIRALGFDYYKSTFSVELDSLSQMKAMLEAPVEQPLIDGFVH